MHNAVMILLIWNMVVMLVYGVDKFLAKKETRRISEKSLLLSAFLLGGLGAIFGMVLFHHKTAKMKFRMLVPLSVIVEAVVLYFIMEILY